MSLAGIYVSMGGICVSNEHLTHNSPFDTHFPIRHFTGICVLNASLGMAPRQVADPLARGAEEGRGHLQGDWPLPHTEEHGDQGHL